MSCPDGKAKDVNAQGGSTAVPKKSVDQKVDDRHARLQELLRSSVPAVMAEYQSGKREITRERLMAISDLLGEKGEAFLYRMKETPQVVGAVVDAIAALAVAAQGGVTVFGLHFEAGKPIMTEEEWERGAGDPAPPDHYS